MNTLKESYKHLSDLRVESYWSGYEIVITYLKGKIQESEEHYIERLEYEQDKLDQWELDYALHIERVNKEKQEEIDKKSYLSSINLKTSCRRKDYTTISLVKESKKNLSYDQLSYINICKRC